MKGTHEHHILPAWTYYKTFFALFILMALTIAAALFPSWTEGTSFSNYLTNTPQGSWIMNIVALLIAVTKGMLVISIFMGVKYASNLIKLWAMTGFVWFSLMFITLVDYGTRRYEPAPTWNADTGSAMIRRMDKTSAEPGGVKGPYENVTVRPR